MTLLNTGRNTPLKRCKQFKKFSAYKKRTRIMYLNLKKEPSKMNLSRAKEEEPLKQ